MARKIDLQSILFIIYLQWFAPIADVLLVNQLIVGPQQILVPAHVLEAQRVGVYSLAILSEVGGVGAEATAAAVNVALGVAFGRQVLYANVRDTKGTGEIIRKLTGGAWTEGLFLIIAVVDIG